VAKPVKTANRKSRSIKNLTKHVTTPSATTSNDTISTTTSNEAPKVGLKSDTTAKRNSMLCFFFYYNFLF
jgi:hypothetical protein